MTVETPAERVERLDDQIVRAIMATISEPEKYGLDCQQEGRLRVLEAGPGHSDAWYVRRAVWKAQEYEAKQTGSRRLVKTQAFGGEIDAIDGGHHYERAKRPGGGPPIADYSPSYRRPLHDYRLWRRAGSIIAGYTGHSGGGRMQGVCTECGRGHYRPGDLCPVCVLATSPGVC